ncbi:TIGR03084 family metal-binding protein [Amycolatopsis sp. YIM 10]|uniref:TIGR03084 family metal-binding protein n=1 Tax=Amycolatopsis sp. YIM 10 TaxID=2653857 RepID=UPI00129043C2|nr:TIGR03084 family metal-binding protein [Amycolatopsis sp. YIM 10]QFU88849.1 mycothiol-dependent maleylpyruvate isomerase [Amycolatopsis sp. YIM 10]
MADVGAILRDLAAESAELDEVVAALPEPEWARPTPADGWTIAHQIAHLAWTDDKALIAVRTPEKFAAEVEKAFASGGKDVDEGAEAGATAPPAELLARWRQGREDLARALAEVPGGQKVPWYGPPMSPASMVTARIMETWAHAQDVFDALGLKRVPTDRLWQIARFGVRTRDFAYTINSRTPPDEEFRVELTAPDGSTWAWGPEDAAERITGSALGFVMVVTQRRHPADTDLRTEGDEARAWLGFAQAFAGLPGSGRRAGQFA